MLFSWRIYDMHLALFLKAGCDTYVSESAVFNINYIIFCFKKIKSI
jgi:hypothetical protein